MTLAKPEVELGTYRNDFETCENNWRKSRMKRINELSLRRFYQSTIFIHIVLVFIYQAHLILRILLKAYDSFSMHHASSDK